MADSDDDVPVAEILRRRQLAAAAVPKTLVKPSTTVTSSTTAILKPKSLKSTEVKQSSNEIKRKVEAPEKRKIEVVEKSSNKKSKTTIPSPVKSSSTSRKKKIESESEDSSSEKSSEEEEEGDEDGDEPRTRRLSAQVTAESKGDGFFSLRKGFLAQTLLVRWWYAIKWPVDNGVKPKTGFETLDGFTGVYISTRQGSLGTVQDTRDQTTCPCLANFKLKKSRELRDLCVTAINEQVRQLEVAEGSGTVLESSLKKLLKDVVAVNCDEADREAEKFLGKRH